MCSRRFSLRYVTRIAFASTSCGWMECKIGGSEGEVADVKEIRHWGLARDAMMEGVCESRKV